MEYYSKREMAVDRPGIKSIRLEAKWANQIQIEKFEQIKFGRSNSCVLQNIGMKFG